MAQVSENGALSATTPSSDPACSLIGDILKLVPVSAWAFMRFRKNGDPEQMLGSPEIADARDAWQRHLRAEFSLQRRAAPSGPRVALSLDRLPSPYVHGVTMLFADERRTLGMLSLARTGEDEPFNTIELRALTLTLDVSIDLLSGFPQQIYERYLLRNTSRAFGDRATPELLVLDSEFNVLFTSAATRLPAIIEKTVRESTATWWQPGSRPAPAVSIPLPFLAVRTLPLQGPEGLFVGVLLERAGRRRGLGRASVRYAFSERETQVLAQVLEGATIEEIAASMHITPSTVQDHIKSLIAKTDSHNRSEMIAKVLGWQRTRA